MPTTQIAVPNAISVITAPNASPGGGWIPGVGVSGLKFQDGVIVSAAPWNGNNTGWQGPGQSDYLLASQFNFGFNPTDILQKITLELVLRYGQPGQTFSFPDGSNVDLAIGLNLVGLYEGGLIGVTTQIGFSSSVNQGITGIATYIYTPNASPTIAQINSTSFGVLVQAMGLSTGVGGTNAYGTNSPQGLRVGIDFMQLTIQTGMGTTNSGGGGGGTTLLAAIAANSCRDIPPFDILEEENPVF